MKQTISFVGALLVLLSGVVSADELTKMIEQDLARLGYETGPVDGEETLETVIAISKFQSENGLEVTGEVSSDLARTLMAAQPGDTGSAPTPAAPAPASAATAPEDPAALQAAQQACLQEKAAAAQAAQKKKRGFGSLLSAVSRTASGTGNYDIAETTTDIYSASATADDLSSAAKDLGLTEDDVAACQNPE